MRPFTILTALLILWGLGCGYALEHAGAEEAPAEEEAVLEGEAKAAYEADLKKFDKRYSSEIKNRDQLLQMLNELEASRSRAARDWLIQFAKKVKSAEYRARAFEALVKIGGRVAIAALCGKDGLRAAEFNIQTQAAAALERSADKRSIPALLDALDDSAVKMETLATVCLTVGKVGYDDPKVEETLFRMAADRRDTVRAAAVEALGRVKNDKSFEMVLTTLQKEKNATVRVGAAKGLGHAGRQEAIPALKAAVAAEKSQPVREAALAALQALGATPD